MQNLAPGWLAWPHFGQLARRETPHSGQNFAVAGIAVWHFGQLAKETAAG
jgi:hypothetical protein